MKQVDKLPYAKTQPFDRRRARVGSSRISPGLPLTGRLAAPAESVRRFQDALARPGRPELRPSMAGVDSHGEWAPRLKVAAVVIARWVAIATVVGVIHLAVAKYVFLA